MSRHDQPEGTVRRGDGPWLVLFLVLLAVGAKPAAEASTKPRTPPPAPTSAAASSTTGDVVRLALAQARRMHASPKVTLALIEAGIVESNLRNLDYGDRDSLGYLQQRPSQGWPCPVDVACATRDFLRRAIPIQHRYATSGRLAQAVQRSAYPDRYDRHAAQARQVIRSYQRRHP